MWTAAFLATTLTLAGLPAQQPSPATFSLQVSTPTHFADGVVRGASGTFGTLRIGQPTVLYVYSGKTMCESSSPATAVPADAGFGWRLDVTPVREANGLVLQVAWQRLWDRGARLSNGQRGHAEVTLKPGGKLLFDYLGGAETTTACDAIGMGLEVGLAPATSQGPLVETELWLVHKLSDGTEVTQRQVVRQRTSEPPVPFYFDDVRIGNPPNEVAFKASGSLQLRSAPDGKLQMSVVLAQSLPDTGQAPGIRRAGSVDLTAAPGEVVSLPLPATWLSRSSREGGTLAQRLDFAKAQLTAALGSGKTEQHPDVKRWRMIIADLEAGNASDQARWVTRKDETFSVRLRAQIVK